MTIFLGMLALIIGLNVAKVQNLKILSELKISIPSFELIDTEEIAHVPLIGQNNFLGMDIDEASSLSQGSEVSEERFGNRVRGSFDF